MITLKAFKALRPRADIVQKVAELPYDVMNSKEAKEIAKGNKYSFLHVDKAEIDLDENINLYDREVYIKANENLQNMIDSKVLIQDEKENLYIYRLIMNGKSQVGIVACTSIDDYINNKIKKHEHTRKDKEQDRINHVDFCDANTGPIFLTYKYNDKIDNLINTWIQKEPVYDFTAEDGVKNTVWVVNDEETINNICNLFKDVDSLYIADGHHRAASAVKVALKRREENPNYLGSEEFNFFLSVIFPHSHLNIIDYNRIVKDLNGLSNEEYMNKVLEKFNIDICKGQGPYKPSSKHNYGMYLNGRWYRLTAKEGTYDPLDPVERLDVSILQNNLLDPILEIKDPRTDNRIDFVGGIRGLKELEHRIDEKNAGVAFSMYPTTLEDLMNIADAGEVMPPKSTWFEPKLRSGLFIHKLK